MVYFPSNSLYFLPEIQDGSRKRAEMASIEIFFIGVVSLIVLTIRLKNTVFIRKIVSYYFIDSKNKVYFTRLKTELRFLCLFKY